MVYPCLGHLAADDGAGSIHQHYADDQPDHQHRGASVPGASLRTGPRQPPRYVRRQTTHHPSQSTCQAVSPLCVPELWVCSWWFDSISSRRPLRSPEDSPDVYSLTHQRSAFVTNPELEPLTLS